MNYAVVMGTGSVICIPRFIKFGLGIQKLLGGKHMQTQRHTARWSHKPTFIFLNNESRLQILSEYYKEGPVKREDWAHSAGIFIDRM
jgi:hypothetical protein